MTIFVINDFIPYPTHMGALWRVYGLISHLSKRHKVVLFAPTRVKTDPEGIKHLQSIGIEVETVQNPGGYGIMKAVGKRVKTFFSPIPVHWVLTWDDSIAQAISDAIKKHNPDLIYAHHLSTCRFYDSFAKIRPVVLDQHNVESELEAGSARAMPPSLKSALRRWEVRKALPFETQMMRKMDLVVAVSDRDREILQSYAPQTKMATVPNGVELSYFTKAQPTGNKSVVFTGTMSYPPNIEGAIELATKIMPEVRRRAPDAALQIVGRNPVQQVRQLAGSGVEVLADVPDIRPYIENAGVVAAPIRSGSGTRLKILEAMAMGKAIVSTSKGAEGIDLRDGHDILLRDDPESFAQALADALVSTDMQSELGSNARSTVEAKYGYDALSKKLEAEFTRLLEK